MKYVDGYVLPVKRNDLDAYQKIAAEAGEVWLRHGALQYFEAVGEDLNPTVGGMEFPTFPDLAGAGEDETVIFAFIVFKSREHRDEVNQKVFTDPDMNDPEKKDQPMPFDLKRMAYGGFQVIMQCET